jgi:mRNA interferase MazF
LRRGDLYRVRKPGGDPKSHRVFVVASRQPLIESRFSTVICAPIHTRRDGLATQVNVGIECGLKHDSAIHCDELVSLPKRILSDYVGSLTLPTRQALNRALQIALELA